MHSLGPSLTALGALAVVPLGIPARALAERLHVDGQVLRDARGGMRLLRGVNVAGDAKVPPFRPVSDPAVFDRLAESGVNVVRLLFTWEAYEAERDHYDERYLAYYAGLVEALHARGIGVIVDVHQDAFSRFTTAGCGEGFPAWAVSRAVPLHAPDNGEACASWGIQMLLDSDTRRCWDDFYEDAAGVRTKYLALLHALSKRFASHDGVLGYDVLNEPAGDEVQQLAPLLADAARVVRANDPDALLFVSPAAITSGGSDTSLPAPRFGGVVYAPHYYDALVITFHTWAGGDLSAPIGKMRARAAAWGVPLFIGEFGGPGSGSDIAAYVDAFYAELDAHFVSGAQWAFVAHPDPLAKDGWNREDFTLFDVSGAARPTHRLRAHVVRIAGEPVSFAREESPAALTLVWKHDPARGETRVFVPPAVLGGKALALSTADDVACAYERDGRHLRCTSPSAGQKRVRLSACTSAAGCVDSAAPSSMDAGVPALPEEAGLLDAQLAMVHDAAPHDAAPHYATTDSARDSAMIRGLMEAAATAMPEVGVQSLPSIDAALPTPASAQGAETQFGCSLGGPGHARNGLPWWLAGVLLCYRAAIGRALSRSRRGLWPR
jgi:endoglycosylceramidase